MKRYGNLFEKIVDLDNIILAHTNARKGKTKYKEVEKVDKDILLHCKEIQHLLISKGFKSSEYTMFIKYDKGKDREIFKLPYFPDRIIQHAIMQVVEPIWKKSLIQSTYQAIKGRGVHSCLARVKKAVNTSGVKYCLQVDVKKFYPSIDNKLLKIVVRKKIKCKDTLWAIDTIIDGHQGVPIGNYISQYLGNLFLSELDHIMKEVYRVPNYFRYCDDIIVIDEDKELLHLHLVKLREWLFSKKLQLKENYQVYEITDNRPVDCLGYDVTPSKVYVRKRILHNMYKAVNNKKVSSLPSYLGWFAHCSYQPNLVRN